jgi:hypothetical protein
MYAPVRYVPLMLLIAACAAPPTPQQVTSRAVKRNCEAQGTAAAEEVRRQNVEIIEQGSAENSRPGGDVDARAEKARRDAFRDCMREYAL